MSLVQIADAAGIEAAAALLRDGRLVAFPTETVYGLGADARNGQAVAAIFEAKGRPHFNPLISHFAEADAVWSRVVGIPLARRLAESFWPGALTLVLPRAPACDISELACAGLATAAVRVPAHPVARALLRLVDRPVAAPSANRSGRISPTTAAHVAAELDGRIAMVLDGGACPLGLESTVVGFSDGQPVLLRPGGIPAEEIEAVAGPLAAPDDATDSPAAPGMLASHYAPESSLRLEATRPEAGEAYLGFGPGPEAALNLSPDGDLREAAANLFAMLHCLDAGPERRIAVAPIPAHGLGLAINDRLRRAAAPRPAA